MKDELTVIMPLCPERAKRERINGILTQVFANCPQAEVIEHAADLRPLHGRRILFAVVLGKSGVNLEYYAMLKQIRLQPDMFTDCLGALLVDGWSELYTKSVARELVFAANRSGCAFIGRPLVEGTGSLQNFHVLAQLQATDEFTAYQNAAADLVQRLFGQPTLPPARRIAAIHASSHRTSNTLGLWQLVQQRFTTDQGFDIREINLRNGAVADCSGCPYTMCLHFGERGGCFYGGVMVEDVEPAIEWCDALLLLCPNYNDALSANLTAFVNRLTALFRRRRFYDKRLYAIVVSGYSGSDIVAGQLIAALNMNKTFFLPARFAMTETANDAGSVLRLPGIGARAAAFADRIVTGG